MLDQFSLSRILEALPRLSIALVGDLFLDKYLDLDSRLTEISVETGLEAYQVAKVRCYPGAGGTVLNNLTALGIGKLHAVSVIGDDGEGFELLRALGERGVDTSGVIVRQDRMTPAYTKPMLSQEPGPARELNRLDIKNRTPAAPHNKPTHWYRCYSTLGAVDAERARSRSSATSTASIMAWPRSQPFAWSS